MLNYSTLRYANRAKNIKNKPKINEDPKDALLREYQEEIKKLKMMLMGQMDIPAELQGTLTRVCSLRTDLTLHKLLWCNYKQLLCIKIASHLAEY